MYRSYHGGIELHCNCVSAQIACMCHRLFYGTVLVCILAAGGGQPVMLRLILLALWGSATAVTPGIRRLMPGVKAERDGDGMSYQDFMRKNLKQYGGNMKASAAAYMSGQHGKGAGQPHYLPHDLSRQCLRHASLCPVSPGVNPW